MALCAEANSLDTIPLSMPQAAALQGGEEGLQRARSSPLSTVFQLFKTSHHTQAENSSPGQPSPCGASIALGVTAGAPESELSTCQAVTELQAYTCSASDLLWATSTGGSGRAAFALWLDSPAARDRRQAGPGSLQRRALPSGELAAQQDQCRPRLGAASEPERLVSGQWPAAQSSVVKRHRAQHAMLPGLDRLGKSMTFTALEKSQIAARETAGSSTSGAVTGKRKTGGFAAYPSRSRNKAEIC